MRGKGSVWLLVPCPNTGTAGMEAHSPLVNTELRQAVFQFIRDVALARRRSIAEFDTDTDVYSGPVAISRRAQD